MTATDTQIHQLIDQIKNNELSVRDLYLLYLSMQTPGSEAEKIGKYQWLTSLPLPELTPVTFAILIVFGPTLLVVIAVIVAFVIYRLIKNIIPFVLSRFTKSDNQKEFLQLTFPADTSKSAYATEQLYTLIHTIARQLSYFESVIHRKNEFSLELVSTKKEGIRYLLAAHPKFIDVISRNLMSYLPGIKISKATDYAALFSTTDQTIQNTHFIELKFSGHFSLPLTDQKVLSENDTISYVTGNMTDLRPDELIACQMVVSPVMSGVHSTVVSEVSKVRARIANNESVAPAVQKNIIQQMFSLPVLATIWLLLLIIWKINTFMIMFVASMVIGFFDTSGKSVPFLQRNKPSSGTLDPYEQELSQRIKSKLDQPLFEVSMRIAVASKDKAMAQDRISGIVTAYSQLESKYQEFIQRKPLIPNKKALIESFKLRHLSNNSPINQNPIVSTSELADIYHFPYTKTTKTQDLVKVHSRELPAPLSIKNNDNLDVVFGKNTFGNADNQVGLTDDDRSRHVYIIGQTGSGKSTIIYHMVKDDIQKGRGVALLDPHGDLAEDLLLTVPDERINEVIYLNPVDLRHPVGINLLELTPSLEDDELEQEKELVCESVISVFRRVFSKDENTDSHRIEYILRNTIYTAFTIPGATIFTVYELLNNPKYQKRITKDLVNENLKNFWKNEFGKAGNFQVVKMVSGVTAKVGRFLFSPTAKRILEQSKSTINFDDILESGKVLICNLSEGKLGEDTSQLLGTTVIAKIQQAAMRRIRTKKSQRTPFYLFVDEFQNFATSSFTKLLSGGRKFGLRLTIAEQSTSQQDDRNVVNVILTNTGTVVCFRTASPIDEQLMLSQFSPYVEKGDIVNLPRYKFYMKLSAVEPEEPFSGQTLPITIEPDPDKLDRIIETSRKNFAIVYKKHDTNNQKITSKPKRKSTPIPENEDVGTLT
jgi:ABC-type multidrug transport system fused ATPase/permease subunit